MFNFFFVSVWYWEETFFLNESSRGDLLPKNVLFLMKFGTTFYFFRFLFEFTSNIFVGLGEWDLNEVTLWILYWFYLWITKFLQLFLEKVLVKKLSWSLFYIFSLERLFLDIFSGLFGGDLDFRYLIMYYCFYFWILSIILWLFLNLKGSALKGCLFFP